jgi:hypothetical protein
MELSKRAKIALGIATACEVIFPILIAFLYMIVFFLTPLMMATDPKNVDSSLAFFFLGFLIFFMFMIFFSIFQIVLKILYLVLVIRNKKTTDQVKILFVLGTFYIPYIAMPLYFVLYYLNEKSEKEETLSAEGTVSPD